MQTTFDRSKWVDDDVKDKERDALDQRTSPVVARELFPFRARAKKRLAAYGLAEGEVFLYARCRMTPQFYPIEVMIGIAGDPKHGHPRKLYASSDEIQLLEV